MTSDEMKSKLQYFVDWVDAQSVESMLPMWWDRVSVNRDFSWPEEEHEYFWKQIMDLVTAQVFERDVAAIEYMVIWIVRMLEKYRERQRLTFKERR